MKNGMTKSLVRGDFFEQGYKTIIFLWKTRFTRLDQASFWINLTGLYSYLIFSILFKRAKSKLKQGLNVVIDATNISASIRKKTLDYFSDLDLQRIATVINAPIEVCVSRDKIRTRSVGEDVVLKVARKYEPPTREEGFDEIQIINT